jgi:CRP/FNR family transcriptional regulator, nitrogen fixation regulation protein
MLAQTENTALYTALYVNQLRTDATFAFRFVDKTTWLFGGRERTFRPNEELFGEGEIADHIYKMVSGTVRSYRSLKDGRRKIDAFRLRGDTFGLEVGARRECCAEAVDEVCVVISRRRAAVADGEAAWELWNVTTRELHRVQRHALLLVMNAQQRVASFLIEMARRLCEPEMVELPMSRQDIADYLGLTIETISRTITQFEASGLVGLPTSRQIVLRDPGALQRMTE